MTKYYQHEFERIEDYLHHRPPYLLIDQIVKIENEQIETVATVRQDTFYGVGHFPGAPILPGSMMQEMSTQSAGVLIAARYNPMQEFNTEDPFFNEYALGVLVRVKRARYRGFARPGDELSIKVRLEEKVGEVFDFVCDIHCGDRKVMQNQFQLTNILSSVLQGAPPMEKTP